MEGQWPSTSWKRIYSSNKSVKNVKPRSEWWQRLERRRKSRCLWGGPQHGLLSWVYIAGFASLNRTTILPSNLHPWLSGKQYRDTIVSPRRSPWIRSQAFSIPSNPSSIVSLIFGAQIDTVATVHFISAPIPSAPVDPYRLEAFSIPPIYPQTCTILLRSRKPEFSPPRTLYLPLPQDSVYILLGGRYAKRVVPTAYSKAYYNPTILLSTSIINIRDLLRLETPENLDTSRDGVTAELSILPKLRNRYLL
jgi:hypothetical protein